MYQWDNVYGSFCQFVCVCSPVRTISPFLFWTYCLTEIWPKSSAWSVGQMEPDNMHTTTLWPSSVLILSFFTLIVCLRVNQVLCYSSLIYMVCQRLPQHQCQTTLEGVWNHTQKGFYVSNFPKNGFMHAQSNSQTVHVSATAWFLVRQPINYISPRNKYSMQHV